MQAGGSVLPFKRQFPTAAAAGAPGVAALARPSAADPSAATQATDFQTTLALYLRSNAGPSIAPSAATPSVATPSAATPSAATTSAPAPSAPAAETTSNPNIVSPTLQTQACKAPPPRPGQNTAAAAFASAGTSVTRHARAAADPLPASATATAPDPTPDPQPDIAPDPAPGAKAAPVAPDSPSPEAAAHPVSDIPTPNPSPPTAAAGSTRAETKSASHSRRTEPDKPVSATTGDVANAFTMGTSATPPPPPVSAPLTHAQPSAKTQTQAAVPTLIDAPAAPQPGPHESHEAMDDSSATPPQTTPASTISALAARPLAQAAILSDAATTPATPPAPANPPAPSPQRQPSRPTDGPAQATSPAKPISAALPETTPSQTALPAPAPTPPSAPASTAPSAGPAASPTPQPASPSPPASQLAPALVQLTTTPTGQQVTLQLTPEHLGAVAIRIAQTDTGATHVAVTVERPATLALLQADRMLLSDTLDRAGVSGTNRLLTLDIAPTHSTTTATQEPIQAASPAPASPNNLADSGGYGSHQSRQWHRDGSQTTAQAAPDQQDAPEPAVATRTTRSAYALSITA